MLHLHHVKCFLSIRRLINSADVWQFGESSPHYQELELVIIGHQHLELAHLVFVLGSLNQLEVILDLGRKLADVGDLNKIVEFLGTVFSHGRLFLWHFEAI